MTADTKHMGQFEQATGYIKQNDYGSLAQLVKDNSEFARDCGQAVIGLMYYCLSADKKDFDYGYQLTGDQLRVLAHTRKAGAPIGKGDITIHFDYVARIEKERRSYLVEFPDFGDKLAILVDPKNLADAQKEATQSLNHGIGSFMLHGDTLPKSEYKGRRTARVRPFKVELTLKDLDFEDE